MKARSGLLGRVLLWLAAAFLALIVLSGLSSARQMLRRGLELRQQPTGRDAVSEWQGRLAELKHDLPAEGQVGYVSERDVPGMEFGAVDQDEEFAMTQYALAPLVVVQGTDAQWIVGNFAEPQTDEFFESHFPVRVYAEYGMGIYLFERVQP